MHDRLWYTGPARDWLEGLPIGTGRLAAMVLGPWAGMLVMTAVIGLQALLFQDGGLVVMGANIFNMGLLTALIGYGLYNLSLVYLPAMTTSLLLSFTTILVALLGAHWPAADLVVEIVRRHGGSIRARPRPGARCRRRWWCPSAATAAGFASRSAARRSSRASGSTGEPGGPKRASIRCCARGARSARRSACARPFRFGTR